MDRQSKWLSVNLLFNSRIQRSTKIARSLRKQIDQKSWQRIRLIKDFTMICTLRVRTLFDTPWIEEDDLLDRFEIFFRAPFLQIKNLKGELQSRFSWKFEPPRTISEFEKVKIFKKIRPSVFSNYLASCESKK